MSATASRSVMNTVCSPGRRLICAIWPSTQTAPSRSTYCEMRLAIWRTGAGDCAEVSRGGMPRLYGKAPTLLVGRRSRLSERCGSSTPPPVPLVHMTTDLGTPRVLAPDEADRAVLLAAPRGYCAGVDRAVVTVEK